MLRPSIRPEYVNMDDPWSMFKSQLLKNSCILIETESIEGAPAKLRDVWKDKIVHLSDKSPLQELPWQEHGYENKPYKVSKDVNQIATIAQAAIAESGALMITCDYNNPSSMNFLAQSHCIFINKQNIYTYFEDVPDKIYEEHQGKGAINFISGPSRTADIEQTLLIGAHGPKELVILVYGV